MKPAFSFIIRILLVLFFLDVSNAEAACTSPDGGAGAITWDGTNSVIWCDGGTWHSLADSGGITALTGDVTASGNGSVAATIANNAITSAKILDGTIANADLANMAANTVKGNNTGSAAGPIDLTMTQLRTMIGTGTPGSGNFLRGDGSWQAVPAGTVTGAANHIAYWDGASSITHDASQLVWDAANNGLGIGVVPASGWRQTIDHSSGSGVNGLLMSSNLDGTIGVRLSSTGASFIDFNNTTATSGGRFFRIGNVNGLLSFETVNDAYSAASNRMTILGSGNIGIGTTNPAQKLSVAGTIESTSGGFKFPDGSTQSTSATGLSCNTVTAAFGAASSATATCGAGYTMTGGGFLCGCSNGCMAASSYPNGNGWTAGYCFYYGGTAYGGTTYARCCQ